MNKREWLWTLNLHSLGQCLVVLAWHEVPSSCEELLCSERLQAEHVPASSFSVYFLQNYTNWQLRLHCALQTWTTSTRFLLLAPLLRQLCWNKDRHGEWRKILIISNISKWWKVRSWQTVGFPSTKPRARGGFTCSLLDEKASEAFLCFQKAISLFLAAATSGVEESSHLLYMAGSSSKDFKDFKVPETEVQQWYDRSNGKIFRSTVFFIVQGKKTKKSPET